MRAGRGVVGRIVGSAVLLAVAGAGLVACHPVPAGWCANLAGLDKWVWDGEAGTTAYGNAVNWNHNGNSNVGVPGERNDPNDADDYVCIPNHDAVTIPDGGSAHLVALDNDGTLTVTTGAKLELKGNPSTQPSYSYDLVLKGLLFGRGKLTTRSGGTLTWAHDPAALGAASMSTREDTSTNTVLAVPPDPGRTVIAPGATLRITGLGVNLFDRRIIDNQGTTEVVGSGTYVAADWGTTFRNAGTFQFTSDGDYVQGFVRGNAALGRSRFINIGLVRKTGGTGTSVVDAQYSRTEGSAGPGTAQVSSGSLSILSPNTVASVVPGSSGATFATGGCPASSACANPTTSTADTQYASLKLPGGSATSNVTITEAAPDGSKGRPVDLSVPSETASASNPMVLRLAVDSTLLGPGDTHLTLDVTHDGAAPLPNCTASPVAACVDRGASTTVGGDVVLVVKTASNGRWRIL